MGWSRGSEMFEAIVPEIASLNKDSKKRILEKLYEWASDQDWDTQYEVAGLDPVLDEILKEHGDYPEED